MIDMTQWNRVGDTDATFVFFLENNIRRLLINADTEPFELVLDDSFLGKRLVDVQNDKDEMTGLGHSDHLTTSAFSILGSLDDSR